ncbi:carboxy methyl transferase for protein phosphatase 2A [Thecaphora frezii]
MSQPPAPPLRDPLANLPPSAWPPLSSESPNAGLSSAPPLSLGLPRGRGGRSNGQTDGRNGAMADDAIRQTDSDALISRISALRLGYLPPDPYSEEFLMSDGTQRPSPFFRQPAAASPLHVDRHAGHHAPPSRSSPSSEPPALHVLTPQTGERRQSTRLGSAFGYEASGSPHAPANPLAAFAGAAPGARRPPLINIGTYLRCRSIDQLVEAFLLGDGDDGDVGIKGKGKQIVSLGAGSDGRYWRIMASPELRRHLSHYLELDFPQLTSKKVASIRRSSRLQSQLELTEEQRDAALGADARASAPDSLRSERLSIRPFDLRDFGKADEVARLFSGLDPSLPTLLLFECVLAYIEPEAADVMLAHFGRRFDRVAAVGYDMCLAGESSEAISVPPQVSRFGRVMLQNLESRRLSLPGAKAALTIQDQANRYTRLWPGTYDSPTSSGGKSLYRVWEELDPNERERISRLERLDEVEELRMLLSHYCITWASRGV